MDFFSFLQSSFLYNTLFTRVETVCQFKSPSDNVNLFNLSTTSSIVSFSFNQICNQKNK